MLPELTHVQPSQFIGCLDLLYVPAAGLYVWPTVKNVRFVTNQSALIIEVVDLTWRQTQLAFEEIDKERLAFVSGNILICGLLSSKVWPFVSSLQTGMHINIWTDTDPGGEAVGGEYYVFTFLTKLLTAMISTAVLAIIYIVLQGLWLSIASGHGNSSGNELDQKNPDDRLEFHLDHWSRKIYGAVFLSGPYLFLWVLQAFLGLMVVPLEKALAPFFNLSLTLVGWILRPLLVVGLTILLFILVHRIGKLTRWESWRQRLAPYGKATLVIAVVMLLVIDPIVTHVSYTLDLKIKDKVVDSSQTKHIEIGIVLGGATSASKEAKLQLLTADAQIVTESLTLNDLGKGHYVAIFPLSGLPPGRYQILLEYPHYSFESAPPFLVSKTRRTEWFLVRV